MKKVLPLVMLFILILSASVVLAQDELSIGSTEYGLILSNDTLPTFLRVTTQGEVDLESATSGGSCNGFTNSDALVRFTWIEDSRIPQIVFTGLNEIEVEVVLWDPNMRSYWCTTGDNTVDQTVDYPVSGPNDYYVWIASAEPNQVIEGTLTFTHPNVSLANPQQEVNLMADPRTSSELVLDVGGDIDISWRVNDECQGFISRSPSLLINWDGGAFPTFNLSEDVGILLWDLGSGEEGEWLCADAGNQLRLPQAMSSGEYYIWFSVTEPSEPKSGIVWVDGASTVDAETAPGD